MLNANTGNCVHSDKSLCEETGSDEEEAKAIIVQAFYCRILDKIVLVTYDHNILFLNSDFTLHRQVPKTKSVVTCCVPEVRICIMIIVIMKHFSSVSCFVAEVRTCLIMIIMKDFSCVSCFVPEVRICAILIIMKHFSSVFCFVAEVRTCVNNLNETLF